jgi:hypothetical protein
MGSIVAFRRSFLEKFRFPEDLSSDSGYIYIKSIDGNPQGFRYAEKASVFFRYPDNVREFRRVSTRIIFDKKKQLKHHFGDDYVDKLYRIPSFHKVHAVLKRLLKQPFGTVASIFLGLYVRVFKFHDKLAEKGMWETTASAKKAIRKT